MSQQFHQIDAFTDTAYKGNPAAVCILETPKSEEWMQQVANEMNLSETAFLEKKADGSYHLRWFTPTVEIKLCGHATLASAHVLYENGHISPRETAHFHTLSGVLKVQHKGDYLEMDFPATPPEIAALPDGLVEALGTDIQPDYVGKSSFDYVLAFPNEEIIRGMQPNFSIIKKLPVRGVIVTAPSSMDSYDIVSRFFAPAAGVDEDPVTGSAHCCLTPYWAERLGKDNLTAYQASKRGGHLQLIAKGNRVALGGTAVTVMKGEILAI